MFFDVLDKLRKKPPHTKSMIALTVSGSITLALALFWIVSFGGYVSEKTQAGMFGAVAVPFNEITNSLSDGFAGIQKRADTLFKDDLGNIKDIQSQIATSTKDYSMYDIPSEIEDGIVATSTSEKELIQ